jgi:serine/threonine-protein kinase HipA
MMVATPVWIWLPGQNEPVRAGHLVTDGVSRFIYAPEYLKQDGTLALDPVELRLNRSSRGTTILGVDGLPGVIRDAMPSGYGADRLKEQHGDDLGPRHLLELGVPDGVGAVEACDALERKLAWRPITLGTLQALTMDLDEREPSSRALNDHLGTSAGGERPKVTVESDGRLWLAKMQARGDRPAMPAREFVTMKLASAVGIDAASVRLHTLGSCQVLMVERFDRAGDPYKPTRKLYASAHTVLRLRLDAVRGDPERSYLALADRLRVWARAGPTAEQERLGDELAELWRRVAFNALVGNTDDHAFNTGLLCHDVVDGRPVWGLSPAFDITPNISRPQEDGPNLAMATGIDGLSGTSLPRLLEAADRFGLDKDEARTWLTTSAHTVAGRWEGMLREASAPIMADASRVDLLLASVRPSFAYAERIGQELA